MLTPFVRNQGDFRLGVHYPRPIVPPLNLEVDLDRLPVLREYLSTGYGLRFSTEIYGSKREKTVFHEYLQEYCFVLTEISENIWKPPGVYGRM